MFALCCGFEGPVLVSSRKGPNSTPVSTTTQGDKATDVGPQEALGWSLRRGLKSLCFSRARNPVT